VNSHNPNQDFRSSLMASIDRGCALGLEDLDFGKDQMKSSLKILNDLDLDRINELRHIYSICDIDQQGFVAVEKLRIRKFKNVRIEYVKIIQRLMS